MENENKIVVTQADFQKLTALLKSAAPEASELLEEELSRAVVVPDEEFPSDAVSMDSKVRFIDLDSKKESVFTLVYPHDADIEQRKVSVLAPVGIALLGLRVGQVINWPLPNGKTKRLRVVSVLFQPEAESTTV